MIIINDVIFLLRIFKEIMLLICFESQLID